MADTIVTKSALEKMFKTRFFQGDLTRHGDIKTPFGDLVAKEDDFYGASLVFPFNYTGNHGIGPSLTDIYPETKVGSFDKWVIDEPTYMYGKLKLDIISMMRSSRDVGSYLKTKTKETLAILRDMKEARLGVQVWGDGACDLARVEEAVTGASDTSTIVIQGDAVKLKKGMYLQANSVRTGSAGTLKTDVYKVAGVERLTAAGKAKVSFTRVSGAADDWAINDYIYEKGFYDSGMKGVQAWITPTTPGTGVVPGTLFGMDRTDEPEMKAGWRGTWQGSIRETILNLVSIMGQYFDPNFSALWVSPANWFRLSQELLSMGCLCYDNEASQKFGTKVITFAGPQGDVKVMADSFCPSTDVFALRHGDFKIITMGELIHLADEDLEALRLPDSDGLEIRYRSVAQMVCPYPWKNGRAPIN